MSLNILNMTNRRLGGVAAILGVAFCISGCVGAEVSQEQVSVRVEDAKVVTSDELAALLKKLPSLWHLQGECLSPGGVGSDKLQAYVVVASEASKMPVEDFVEIYRSIEESSLDRFMLSLIGRLIYDVPASYPYLDPNIERADPDETFGKKFWTESPVADGAINYLHPLEIDENGMICVKRLIATGGSGLSHSLLGSELEFFDKTFPKRDLSVYLEKQ